MTAGETAQVAAEARASAEVGEQAVAKVDEAMRGVQSSSADVSAAIRELGDKSTRIGGIVDTITAIAEQTNLLALNAAIEAARAGEQGKGFAVVAEEVRKLAEESQQAAASIADLVSEIRSETERAVTVVEHGVRQTDEGAQTVIDAREAFQQIRHNVESMTERIEQIAASSDPDRRQRHPDGRERQLRGQRRRGVLRLDRAGLGGHRADQRLHTADRLLRPGAVGHRRRAAAAGLPVHPFLTVGAHSRRRPSSVAGAAR